MWEIEKGQKNRTSGEKDVFILRRRAVLPHGRSRKSQGFLSKFAITTENFLKIRNRGFENSQLLHKFQKKIRKRGSEFRRFCDFSQGVAALPESERKPDCYYFRRGSVYEEGLEGKFNILPLSSFLLLLSIPPPLQLPNRMRPCVSYEFARIFSSLFFFRERAFPRTPLTNNSPVPSQYDTTGKETTTLAGEGGEEI